MTHPTELLAFLESDPLRHITPLKILLMFGERVRVTRVEHDAESAFILMMRREESHWDSAHYPEATHVVYSAIGAAPSDAMIRKLASRIVLETGSEAFVLKTIEPRLIDALKSTSDARMPMSYRLALLTFVPNADPSNRASDAQNVSKLTQNVSYTSVPPEARELLSAHNGFSADELNTVFADGTARCWLRFVNDSPVALLLSFANSKSLHEIGSLHVSPHARRAGHARALVDAALADLRARELAARYLVDATNDASVALARGAGLNLTYRAEHWVTASGR